MGVGKVTHHEFEDGVISETTFFAANQTNRASMMANPETEF